MEMTDQGDVDTLDAEALTQRTDAMQQRASSIRLAVMGCQHAALLRIAVISASTLPDSLTTNQLMLVDSVASHT